MKPVLQALLLAELVITDEKGRKIIVGTFNGITRRELQVRPQDLPDGRTQLVIPGGGAGSPYAYISVTDVIDGTSLTLRFVNLKKNEVLFESTLELKCKDRLQTIEIVAHLPNLVPFTTEDGIYAFELMSEGELLGFHRLIVRSQ